MVRGTTSLWAIVCAAALVTGCNGGDKGTKPVTKAPPKQEPTPTEPKTPPKPADWYGDSADSVATLEQGWTADVAELWYTTPQGSKLIPFDLFVRLERADSEELFRDDHNIRKYRFLTWPKSEKNPDALPIGFVRDGEHLGMTCAACHTNQINYRGKGVRVEGAPTLADLQGFMRDLDAAMVAALEQDDKFARLAGRALGDDAKDEAKLAALKDRLRAARVEVKADYDAVKSDSPYGFARYDAFGVILNRAFRLVGSDAHNDSTGPVSYPHLWDTPQHDYVQWNGFASNAGLGPLQRNVGQVIGVFGTVEVDPTKVAEQGYPSSVNVKNLFALEKWVRTLQSPLWPEDVLPKLDQGRVTAGKPLFDKHCAGCHKPVDRADPNRAVTAMMYGVETVGTDPVAAKNIVSAVGTTGRVKGLPEKLQSGDPLGEQALGLQVLSNLIAGILANSAKTGMGKEIQEMAARGKMEPRKGSYPQDPKNPLATFMAYKARSLNGIWATAPYLHNGSVPTLADLLLPPEKRPTQFWVGKREFDPEKVGFVSGEFEGGSRFDTAAAGNSNAGHTYGTNLTDDERLALLEYLKSI